MGQTTKIEWCDHTFNPWRGCTKISEGCKNCYAETMSKRNHGTLGKWGPTGTRVVASESMWKEPLKWDRQANSTGVRKRVFCASLADVFEDWDGPMMDSKGNEFVKTINNEPVGTKISENLFVPSYMTMQDIRHRLFELIDKTPNLDWLLLTKRPENVRLMTPPYLNSEHGRIRPNVWIGTSVENQKTADERIPHLLKIPAKVRFLSCEPLLGPVDLLRVDALGFGGQMGHKIDCIRKGYWSGGPFGFVNHSDMHDTFGDLHWVIVGGESGADARCCYTDWIIFIVEQCKSARVPVFVKQLGSRPEYQTIDMHGPQPLWQIDDKKSADPDEWPEDLRVREFPPRINTQIG